MIKHQGCRVPPSVQADHASAPTFLPVPPPPRNALPHLLHPTCHPALPPLAVGTSPAPPPTSTAKQTPCSQPIPPRAPLPLPLPPHPHYAGGGRARGRQLGAGDLTHHPNTGTLCNTHATLHTDPPVMPVSSCCSKPRAAGPATASLRPPSGTGPGRAVTVRVGQDEGSSWDSRAVGVGLQPQQDRGCGRGWRRAGPSGLRPGAPGPSPPDSPGDRPRSDSLEGG